MYKSDHERHVSTHFSYKLFGCRLCGAVSNESGNLKKHINTHFSYKLFGCRLCGAVSTTSGHLKTHINTHFSYKLFGCRLCGAVPTQSRHLKTHINTHFSYKLFGCRLCGKTASSHAMESYHRSRYFCALPQCSFVHHLGICSRGDRYTLPGHPAQEPSCAAHVNHLLDNAHIGNDIFPRWPLNIPSSQASSCAYPGHVDDVPPPLPIGPNLYPPMMKTKNPPPESIPDFTVDRFLEAIREFTDQINRIGAQLPPGWTAQHVAGFILGQAFGDGNWNNGAIIAFWEQDDAGIGFYESLVTLLGGDQSDVHRYRSQGCIRVLLRGVTGGYIKRMLNNLQYGAAYKYVNMTLLDVFRNHHQGSIIITHFMMGCFAGLISSDGSGVNNCISFCQSQWWHGDIIILIREIGRLLGIQIMRGYARRGPVLAGGWYHPSMHFIFRPCVALRNLSFLITAGPKRNSALRGDVNDVFHGVDFANLEHILGHDDFANPDDYDVVDDPELENIEAGIAVESDDIVMRMNEQRMPARLISRRRSMISPRDFDLIRRFVLNTSVDVPVPSQYSARRAHVASGGTSSLKSFLVRATPGSGGSPRDSNVPLRDRFRGSDNVHDQGLLLNNTLADKLRSVMISRGDDALPPTSVSVSLPFEDVVSLQSPTTGAPSVTSSPSLQSIPFGIVVPNVSASGSPILTSSASPVVPRLAPHTTPNASIHPPPPIADDAPVRARVMKRLPLRRRTASVDSVHDGVNPSAWLSVVGSKRLVLSSRVEPPVETQRVRVNDSKHVV